MTTTESVQQHTPGPWSLNGPDHIGRLTVVSQRDGAIVEMVRHHVDGRTFPIEANARLIAAAPSLLDALEGLLENAEIDALNEPELVPAVEAARQAIADAYGFTDYETYNLNAVEAIRARS